RGDGLAFATTAEVTLGAGGSATVPIACVVTGAAGNSPVGTTFSLTSGVVGIASAATTITAISGGAEVEGDNSLRSRMLLAYANPPQGGSASDYRQWSLAVPGVTRAWVA
ncbi:baseplate J/gp47 family protein, partial [Mycobacterium tuberculosis]